MGTYEIPRNTKGEGRLFYIFSTKALIYTVVGILVGFILKWLLGLFGKAIPSISGVMNVIGIIIMILFAAIGFAIGTFKVPQIDRFNITKKAAGLNIDKVLLESIKFRLKGKKYYVYDTSELMKEEIIKETEDEKEIEEKESKAREEKELNDAKNRRGYIRNER